jgi:hypothetical protein
MERYRNYRNVLNGNEYTLVNNNSFEEFVVVSNSYDVKYFGAVYIGYGYGNYNLMDYYLCEGGNRIIHWGINPIGTEYYLSLKVVERYIDVDSSRFYILFEYDRRTTVEERLLCNPNYNPADFVY